jgi:Fe-S cluster biogenesis protein NfuA
VANEGEFQEQVRQLGKLVAQFDELPDSEAKSTGKELLQLLMEIHGRGLERTMEIVFDSGNFAPGIIDKLAQDSVVGNLMLLYSLHPDGLETRVKKAVERMRPRLRKLAHTVELEDVEENSVRVRLTSSGHSCGSSASELRSIVEEGIYEFAPDITSLYILGLEEPASPGFVTLESLLGQHLVGGSSVVYSRGREGVD